MFDYHQLFLWLPLRCICAVCLHVHVQLVKANPSPWHRSITQLLWMYCTSHHVAQPPLQLTDAPPSTPCPMQTSLPHATHHMSGAPGRLVNTPLRWAMAVWMWLTTHPSDTLRTVGNITLWGVCKYLGFWFGPSFSHTSIICSILNIGNNMNTFFLTRKQI